MTENLNGTRTRIGDRATLLYPSATKMLLQLGYDPTLNDNNAIKNACLAGCLEAANLLLQDPRVDPSAEENYPLRYACLGGHHENIALLLAHPRVDPTRDSHSIRWASEFGWTKIVALLLQDGRINPSADNNRALREAQRNGRVEACSLLLADPRVRQRM